MPALRLFFNAVDSTPRREYHRISGRQRVAWDQLERPPVERHARRHRRRLATATASIDGVSATGNWAASLHGTNNPGFDDFDGDTGDVACPITAGCPAADLAGVAGWFRAFSSVDADTAGNPPDAATAAAIAGAFAAAP